jgi:hypothetical protein
MEHGGIFGFEMYIFGFHDTPRKMILKEHFLYNK